MVTNRPSPRAFDYLSMNVYYFGISFMWNSLGRFLLQALMPQAHLAGHANAEAAFGVLSFLGLLIATIVQPLAGMFSDRFTSRWGRRRPFMFVGTLADLVFLAAIAFAPNLAWLVVAYCLLQFSSNIAHGPYQGLLPDLVPEEKRGIASGVKQFIDTFGLIAAALITATLIAAPNSDVPTNVRTMLALIAFVLVGTMLINVLAVREPPATRAAAPAAWRTEFTRQTLRRAIHFGHAYPDFAWLIGARLLLLGALALLSNYAQFYFQKVLFAEISDLDVAIKAAVKLQGDLLTTVVMVLLAVTLAAGPLADRFGRKPINILGGLIALSGAILLLFVRNVVWLHLGFFALTDLLIAGGLIGAGMGLFASANWAWAVDLTPPDRSAHFLGLTNIATAGATVLSSLFGPAISVLNAQEAGRGFTAMFLVAMAGFGIGVLMLTRVRETRRQP